jgi:glycosyltransferase involved in cell wall biosynthesis
VIVCDDATPGDENEKVIAAFKDKIPNLKYLKNPTNLGFGANCLRSVEEAQGEFFVWLMDDDEISPCFVEASVRTLLDYPEAVCAACYLRWGMEEGESYPLAFMQPDWVKRVYALTIFCNIAEYGEQHCWQFALKRTAVLREATRKAFKRVSCWKIRADTAIDGLIPVEWICEGTVVPVMNRDAFYNYYSFAGKEYNFYGKNCAPSFLQNQLNKLMWIVDTTKFCCCRIGIVYDHGGLWCATKYSMVSFLYYAYLFSSLFLWSTIKGRWCSLWDKAKLLTKHSM